MSRRKNKLVPFETIVLATQGDPQALEQVIRHYRPYILSLCRREYIAEEEGAIVNMVDIDLKAFERKYGEKSVKKTLTIPGWLNASCEERGINFSKVLQEALIARLQAR